MSLATALNRHYHVLLYTDDSQWGGVAQYNHAVLCALVSSGYQVTCVQARADNPLKRREAQLGVRHIWLDYDPSFNVERMLNDPRPAESIFRQFKPDLVIFSNGMPVSNMAARRVAVSMNIPFMSVEGLAAPYLAEMFRSSIPELAEQYARARAVIAVSEDNLHWLHELFGLPKDKGRVLLYGRPSRFFEPPDPLVRFRLRSLWGIPQSAVLCFSAGRLHPLKGFEYQLQAIEHLRRSAVWPQTFFTWAGVGQLEVPIKKHLQETGLAERVKLLGHCDDIASWLDAADIFVLPTEAEGMPLAIMEAMAKGLPVVASAVNGIPEELGPTGKLLPSPKTDPSGAVAALAATIESWATDRELRQKLGSECRERAQLLFREERMIDETMEEIARTLLPEGDYVSPGLAIVRPDRCFPNMVVGDRRHQTWPYFRYEVPHNWYVDRRWLSIGFVSRDEAHLLYNNALQFKGRRALEIGCFYGWSACHLALAGVELDVIDPLLRDPAILESVRASLAAAGVLESVHLHAGASPEAVRELANRQERTWSLIFIDGDHEGLAPLRDTKVCIQFAAPDAMILFHDLASPHVASALEYLNRQGWQTRIYRTMQIMGVAWRGNVEPVSHQPDPRVRWTSPPHLQER